MRRHVYKYNISFRAYLIELWRKVASITINGLIAIIAG